MKLKILSVSKLNQMISDYLITNPIFGSLSVQGEIVNYKKTSYGYSFFSIKDELSKLNCISYEDIDIENGEEIIANGSLSVYKKNGNYSLQVNKIEKVGEGIISQELIKLFENLKKKGYFEDGLKKKIRKYPSSIGVVTSYSGAAIQDIIAVISKRYPLIDLYVYDTKMQGEDITSGIVTGINELDKMNLDAIILSRGGGESDNLAQFNDEEIADSIFLSNTIIISAIGHEIDFNIPDYVADYRASTPSMAAQISVPDKSEVIRLLETSFNNIEFYHQKKIDFYRLILNKLGIIFEKNSPLQRLIDSRYKVKHLIDNITGFYVRKIYNYRFSLKLKIRSIADNQSKNIYKNKNILENTINKIKRNNPYEILKEGYALIYREEELIIDKKQIKTGDIVDLKFYNGKIRVKVEIVD